MLGTLVWQNQSKKGPEVLIKQHKINAAFTILVSDMTCICI